MMTLASFDPSARHALIRAGLLTEGPTLGTRPLLHALLEDGPIAGLDLTPDFAGRSQRDLLATLGIDVDDVHRRASEATSLRLDDPSLWRLRRSPFLPLRVTLTGPGTQVTLNEAARKTLEVALWAARRRGHPSASREDLLWGLLADRGNKAVQILRSRNIDLRTLWTALGAA
ncbi:hypothetical protein Acsp03_18210 [Actinomadura sp. NBRC 104412]|uniref:Clp protease N-terminal domain-containing protein n=1 Tax=Actinomadura sp. NBRC 104412 TaxID=3032203 RepID=UPI0024A35ED1|nr:Clp protease N-terminal domain-containing protein [Actinomadura sp. NBRC 104412]GLZ04355.1 hypothetical protein Acsp03_18210 [Actinomadura sp. NBRC 104412]